MAFVLERVSTRSQARRGSLHTAHGVLPTPFFMTIATKGAVRGVTISTLKELSVPILLANTYHLLESPGEEAMRQVGGLHAWMGWDGPLLTDSGGYQVFSLSGLRRVQEEGVNFQSHRDGRTLHVSPEVSVAMQQAIGSDVMMQLDVLESPSAPLGVVEAAMERSLRWAARAKEYLGTHREASITEGQQLFGIVQGGVHEALRQRSVEGLVSLGLDGYAIGGLSVGETREDKERITAFTAALLPKAAPRYFMGGGLPEEILSAVRAGVDMFDCVIPTRHARHGALFVWTREPTAQAIAAGDCWEVLTISHAAHTLSQEPVDRWSGSPLARTHTRGYVRHLFSMGEMLGVRIATEQNVAFYQQLMRGIREAIDQGIL
jgi:queuine tRNA-ribosyltransferase